MKRLKLNIAHLIGSLGGGGAEQQVVQILNHLNSLAFNRHVIVLTDKKNGFKDQLDNQVKYYAANYRRRAMPIGMFRLIRYLKNHRIDVLHCHMYDPNKIGAIVGTLARVPVVLTSEHGKNLWKKWRHHFVEKHIINRAVIKRVAVSKDIRNLRMLYDGVHPEKIITIPVGVRIPKCKVKIERTPRILGSMGRLDKAKDYPTLIKVVEMIRKDGYDLKLQIAGEGTERERLTKYVHELGLTETVRLPGFQKPEEFLSQIDIFAMSSEREGMPVALLEAMSWGLPVAVTNVGGIPEIIEDGINGIICASRQPRAMADNIIRIIENKDLRMILGRNARKKVIEAYSIDRIANRLGELYIDLFNNRGN